MLRYTLTGAAIVLLAVAVLTLGDCEAKHDYNVYRPEWSPFSGKDTLSWYAKPGDWISNRYPALWLITDWPFKVGSSYPQCAYNKLPLGTVVRITAPNGAMVAAVVSDRIGTPEGATRLDATYALIVALGLDPKHGTWPITIDTLRRKP